MASAVLVVRLIADARQAVSELGKTAKASSKFGKAVTVGATAAGAGMAALSAYAIGGVKAAADDAKAQALLADAMRNSAGASDDAIKSTEDWIAKTALASGVADDDLRPALGNLVRATGDAATAQEAMSTALDISAATGQDVQSVSKTLAKAYAGNATGLKKLGLGLDAATLKGGDMHKIMGEINQTVGGASATAAGTAAGQYARLQVALGETQETLGAALLPALTAVLGVFLPMISTLSQNQTLVMVLVGAFAALAAVLIGTKVALMATTEGTVLNTVATQAANVATKAWTAATKLLRLAMLAMKAAWASNPIGLVVLAVMALVAAFILAYKKVGWFRAGVDGAMRLVKGAIDAVWSWVKKNWPLLLAILLGPFGALVAYMIKHFDQVRAIAETVFNAVMSVVDPVISAFQTLWGWINDVIDILRKIKFPKPPGWLKHFGFGGGGKSATLAAAPSVAGLGRTRAATPTSISGGGIVIQINGALDPQQTARSVQRLLHTADVRSGRRRFA